MNELKEKIFNYIDRPEVRSGLEQDMPRLNQASSSLDVIGDAQEGIEAYLNYNCGETLGALFIALYGLLQAFILQQDAAFHLCEALGHPEQLSQYPDLEAIREIRNRATGHPTKKDRPKPITYHSITQVTLRYEGFTLANYHGANDTYDEIDTLLLIKQQRQGIESLLTSLVSNLSKK